MECISCCLNHFRVIELLDAQTNRHLKSGRSAIELKRDTNLSFLLVSPCCLDACYLDPKFVHLPARACGPPKYGPDFSPFRGACKPPIIQRPAGPWKCS